MDAEDIQQQVKIRCELYRLSRYVDTDQWIYVEDRINTLLEKLNLIRQDHRQAEWDC